MSELIDRIPGQESFLGKLHAVVDTTMQMKARQRISGRSGQLGYPIDSAQDWDLVASLPYINSNFRVAEYHVIFTGDGTQKFPIVLPQFDIRVNGTSESNRVKMGASGADYRYWDSAVQVDVLVFGEPIDTYFESEFQSAWRFYFFYIGTTGSGNFPLRIKPRAHASCGGEFSIVRVQ